MIRGEMDAMLWFADRWWWFPTANGLDSVEFEWRNNRLYLLEPDGTAVEGTVIVGEVSDN